MKKNSSERGRWSTALSKGVQKPDLESHLSQKHNRGKKGAFSQITGNPKKRKELQRIALGPKSQPAKWLCQGREKKTRGV